MRSSDKPSCLDINDQSLFELALAAHELSRPEQARALAERARQAGSLRVLPNHA